jgi:hypothetical protein
MMKYKGIIVAVVAASLMVSAAACSGDDDDTTPTPAPTTAVATATTATNTATKAPETPTTAPTATSTPSAADKLAGTAEYFVYTARAGDTVTTVANTFNGEPGSAKAGYPDQIRAVNNLTGSDLTAGQEIAIPLLATPTDIIPTQGIKNAISQAGSTAVLYLPGEAMVAANGGKLVLHSVEFAPNMAGYRMEYWLADTPAFDATGALTDKAAKVTTPLMVVTGGSLAAGADAHTAQGSGYSVTALSGAGSTTPAALLAGLKAG